VALNIYRVSIIGHAFDATTVVNTMHYSHDRNDDPGPAQLLDEWDTRFTTQYRKLVLTTGKLDRLHAIQVPDHDQVPLSQPATADKFIDLAGTRVGGDQLLSPALTAVAIFRTAIASRRFRGRMFMPPALASNQLGGAGQWTTAAQTWFAECITFLGLAVPSMPSEYDFGVYSRTGAEADDDAFKVITSYSIANRQHWRRSRQFPAP